MPNCPAPTDSHKTWANTSLRQEADRIQITETTAAYVQDTNKLLNISELTKFRAFIENIVKQIAATPGSAVGSYTVTMLYNGRIPSRDAEEIALNS